MKKQKKQEVPTFEAGGTLNIDENNLLTLHWPAKILGVETSLEEPGTVRITLEFDLLKPPQIDKATEITIGREEK